MSGTEGTRYSVSTGGMVALVVPLLLLVVVVVVRLLSVRKLTTSCHVSSSPSYNRKHEDVMHQPVSLNSKRTFFPLPVFKE